MGMKVVFVGPPGAGKGSQAEHIVSKYNLLHLSTGDMLRAARDAKTPVGLKAEEYMSAGKLVPDEVIIAIIKDRIKFTENTRVDCINAPGSAFQDGLRSRHQDRPAAWQGSSAVHSALCLHPAAVPRAEHQTPDSGRNRS